VFISHLLTDALDPVMLAAPAFLFVYYLVVWLSIGPEPKPDIVVTRYEPPDNLSPAAVRYVAHCGADGRSFAAVIAQLAIRGCLRVDRSNGKYKLSRLLNDRAAESALAREEKRILTLLFEDGPVIELSSATDQRNSAQNGRYVFHIHEELGKELGARYFTHHSGFIAIGVLATFASALGLAATAHGGNATGAVFITCWILFCGLGIGLMAERSLLSAWSTAVRARMGWTRLLPSTATTLVFAGLIVFLLNNLGSIVSPSFALMLGALLLINLGWGPLLKRRTPLGRKALDQIEGFRQFLEKVERDKLDRLNPVGEGPEKLDRLVPYAIALEVKEAWGDHLAQPFLTAKVMAGE
jgi:hypothetical protein